MQRQCLGEFILLNVIVLESKKDSKLIGFLLRKQGKKESGHIKQVREKNIM